MIPAERTDELSSLEASAKELDRAVYNLQPAQWTFKPTIDRWSIAECVDHLAVVEERVLNALKGRDRPAEPVSMTDAQLLERLGDRSKPIAAPELVYPTGRSGDGPATFAAFHRVRRETIAFVATTGPSLRSQTMPHPAFGLLDGYQWVITMAGHVCRHLQQIDEIKQCDQFPR
jgi:hypothetical protein